MHIHASTLLLLPALVPALLIPPNLPELANTNFLSPRKGLGFARRQQHADEQGLRFQDGSGVSGQGLVQWSAEDGDKGGDGDGGEVPVVLGVMSACPDAQICEGVFDKVLTKVGGKTDVSLVYIGQLNSSATYGVDCKHGDNECKGNMQQLCFKETYPKRTDWWNFVQCQNYADLSKIGEDGLAQSCAKVGGKDFAPVQECVDERGPKLLQASVRTATHMRIEKSCSIFINDRLVCIHDGTWKNCDSGHEVADFVSEIEHEYSRLNSS